MINRKFRSFTLVELMVVVTVILILTTFVSLSLVNSKKKARDEKRVIDANNIAVALDQYALDHQRKYPDPGCAYPQQVGVEQFCITDIKNIASDLANYLSPFPQDPLGGTGYGYDYVVGSDGQRSAVIVKKIEAEKSLCNVTSPTDADLPDVMKKYVSGKRITTQDCLYYVAR